MTFWKSRYTASLEQQIVDLKADKQLLREEIIRLNAALAQKIVVPAKAPANPAAELPRLGNFLRSRSALEEGSRMGLPIEENPEPRERTKEQSNGKA